MSHSKKPKIGPAVLFRCLLLCLLSATAARLVADQPDITLPGFQPNQTIESHGIDNVNVFSGDSGIVIPLGPEYTLGPTYKFQLKAYNTIKIWRFDSTCPGQVNGTVQHALLAGAPALGAGWSVELGYVGGATSGTVGIHTPEGGNHLATFPSGSSVAYTDDATRLRYTPYTTSCPTVGPTGSHLPTPCYTVETPDGILQTFAHPYTRPGPAQGSSTDFTDQDFGSSPGTRYGLSQVNDQFGTIVLQVNYGDSNKPWKVTSLVLDPVIQARTISYNWVDLPILGGGSNPTWTVLSYITFPATAGKTLKASFTFDSNDAIDRNAYDSVWDCEEHPADCSNFPACVSPQAATVPLLTAITFSDPGASPSFSPFSYSFGYYLNPNDSSHLEQGLLNHITLPMGGTIDYEFQPPGVNEVSPFDPETVAPVSRPLAPTPPPPPVPLEDASFIQDSPGISARTETASGVATRTDYSRQILQEQYFNPPGYDKDHVTEVVDVTTPTGNASPLALQKTTRYFFHYGVLAVPFPRRQDSGLELERRYYADTNSAGAPIRSEVSCYQSDYVPATVDCGILSAPQTGVAYVLVGNVRRQAHVTWYGTNPTGGGSCSLSSVPCTQTAESQYTYPSTQPLAAAGHYEIGRASCRERV